MGGEKALRAGKDGLKLVAVVSDRWRGEAEELFLDALAGTCNVSSSARAAGFSPTAVYRRRRLEAGFAAWWDAALKQGYAALELRLLRRARGLDEAEPRDRAVEGAPVGEMSVAEALHLLHLHKKSALGEGRRASPFEAEPDMAAVRAAVMARLRALRRARGARPGAREGR